MCDLDFSSDTSIKIRKAGQGDSFCVIALGKYIPSREVFKDIFSVQPETGASLSYTRTYCLRGEKY